jgi:thiol-disulfide isomerase/thioredoxin
MIAVLVGTHTSPARVAGPVDTSNLKDSGPAPALAAKGWINSPPLTQGDLRGKVVLYDIWTYSCINCQRTFPYIRAWFDRYTANGLVIVGVHSPEFDFEKVHKNVEAAVKRDDVTWPVALDDDLTIWNAFKNQYWPADYVADRNGHIRYSHFGEGDYTNTENVIRKLLGIPAKAPRAHTELARGDAMSPFNTNPETYLGLRYQDPTQLLIQIQPGAHDYPVPAAGSVAAPQIGPGGSLSLPKGALEAALAGKWTADNEAITSDDAAATILIGVHAKEVNLVMSTKSGKPIDALVELDGQPVPAADRGSSLHVDRNGRTFVTVQAPDMYRLLLNQTVADHVLSVSAVGPGLQAFDFTFG